MGKEREDATHDGGSEKSSQDEGGMNGYWRIFSFADTASWTLNGIAFVSSIAAGTLLPLMDLVFGKFTTAFNNFAIGALSASDFRGEVRKYTLYFVYLFIAKFCLAYIWSMCISISAIRTTKAIRIKFLESTLRQDVGFFDSPKFGSASVQVTTNGNLVNQGISEKLGLTVQGISTFVSAFVVAFAVQWKLTLITLAIVPTIIVVTSICIGIDTKNESKILPIYSKAGQLAEEVFSSIGTVHAFWAHPKLSAKYSALLAEAKKEGMKKSPNYMVLFSTEFFCVLAGYGLAFWQGIRMYAKGEITQPGSIVTVIFAVIVAATALTQVAPQILQITKAASAANELFRVIDHEPEIDSLSDSGERPEECIGAIEIEDVEFTYPSRPDAQILRSLTLSIPANKTTALVGPSGCGKSTIIGLLERWYSPLAGSICLDGQEISNLNIEWLRTNIRLVQQEPVLFNGTVFENVSYGLMGTPFANTSDQNKLKLVQEACEAAYAHEFIENLPQGYETQVGERAGMLSGGQKQRLAIARSIISNPKVLLLDEATSALDPKAESIVQEALDNVSSNRTTLVIAHKLSTVRKADNIVVISNGVVVEQGSHEKLIDLNGVYARLVKAQDLGYGKDERSENEKFDMEKSNLELIRSQSHTATSGSGQQANGEEQATMGYNLLKCLAILLWEASYLWLPFLMVFISCVVGGLTYPALAIVFSQTMKTFQLTPDEMVEKGDFYGLMFFVIAIANLFVYGALGWFSNIVSQTLTYRYRLEMFDNVLRQDRSFFDKPENTTGALASRLSTHPTQLQELLGFNIALILTIVVNLFSSCILALAYGWKLGLVVVFGALPPLVGAGYIRIRLEFKLDDATGARFADSAALATEAVSSIRTVASLTLERSILSKYSDRLRGIEKRSIKALVWTMFWYSLTQSVSFLAMALGFWYGGQLMSRGEYTTTQFFVVFIGVIFSGEAAAQFFAYTTSITKAESAANYVFWLRAQEPSIRESIASGSNEKPLDGGAQVECQEVEFSYPQRPHIQVIRGASATVIPGQVVAFVGASGCGKSTMIALLERFYDPSSGHIRFDSTDISTICPRRYRRHIALVQQEPTLYQGSIRENIALGLETEATDAQIEEACQEANIAEFISSLSEGYGTLVGSKGTQLSGGQKQRIAIARALIRRPRLLLFDEATSALDTESEKIVQAALERASAGRTTIAVAHRLSTIKDADCIFVFARGGIVETGTHQELLDRRGVYWEMCLGQSLDRETH
ncbi:P-loop containing nucleoside triphosphate hydrolase protein [Patellaria atrata CBS 101060]|uniref:P-loop containing nucleoside triphosphate hydrolase protein n=1 Tax=Patellaria atrata CBS 101060 TaxID=1346257 RepID=A0A9P4SB00_9PEZI|nr:P-loop containing nucleoside triphosphate hydrolase protein [Patellaria atrata CBS 101060]